MSRSSSKPHILILGCKNYPPFSSVRVISGGMEVYVWELVRRLERKYDLTLVSAHSHSDAPAVRVLNAPIFGGFALQPISLCFFSAWIALGLAVFGRRIDLVNAQTPLSGGIAWILKKLFGIPYVVSVHIFAADRSHAGGLSRIYGWLERRVLSRADRVISAGYQLKEFLDRRYGFPPERVVVIHPGMDLPAVPSQGPTQAIRQVIEDRSYKVLYLGRLIRENGLLDLLKAFTLLKDLPVRLYLAGNGNLESAAREFIGREGLTGRVILLGIVKGEDKTHLIKNVDMSIRPSYHEVFPVAYLESIACGKPVVATSVGDTDHLARRTGAITLVPTNRPERIAEAIRSKIKEGALAPETVARCMDYIRTIGWQSQAARTEVLFDSIISTEERS